MKRLRRERGNTLAVALIMLTVLTLIAVSALNMSTTGIQVVGNMQFQEEAAAAAQQAIEGVISNTNFTLAAPAAQSIDIDQDGGNDYTVAFTPAPACIYYVQFNVAVDNDIPTGCYGPGGEMLCYWTIWEIVATATDTRTGASATVTQGVRVPAGLNSALAFCGV